jgi:hypothetical protein
MNIFLSCCFVLFTLLNPCLAEDLTKEATTNKTIPITITIRSVRDLRVKEGQRIKIGQLLALKPIDPEAPQGYISKNHDREVEKQKAKLEKVKQIVKEENLPEIIIKHEEAKLRDLEFAAKEFHLGAIDPKAPKETTYRSPVNGIVKRIIPNGGSDGRLTVEIVVELD